MKHFLEEHLTEPGPMPPLPHGKGAAATENRQPEPLPGSDPYRLIESPPRFLIRIPFAISEIVAGFFVGGLPLYPSPSRICVGG